MQKKEEQQYLLGGHEVLMDELSPNDILFFELLNKLLINYITTHSDQSRFAENQEVYTFAIPQRRHKLYNYFLMKYLGKSSRTWKPLHNTYTIHKHTLSHGILNIFVKKNITKDTHILYYTTANEILALQNLGLTTSQALTAKVIETLGHYNLIVEERRIKSNIVTNKTGLKQYIVARAQQHARLLQPLERCINHFNRSETLSYSESVQNDFQIYLLALRQKLAAIHQLIDSKSGENNNRALFELGLDETLLNSFLQYNPEFLEDLKRQHEQHIENVMRFLKDNQKSTSSELSDNLQGFLIYQLSAILDHAQSHNDLITANSDDSLFRGKLRDYIVDAEIQINHYVFDQHNPITREHQSDFRTERDAETGEECVFGTNKVVYQSHVHVGHSKEDQEKVLVGITALDEGRKNQNGPAPQVVKSAGWNNFSKQSTDQKSNRLLAWLLTTLCHAPLSVLNIAVTAITGYAPVANLMQSIEDSFNKKFNIQESHHNTFNKLRSQLGGNNLYTSTLIGKLLNKVVTEVTSVIIYAPILVVEKIREQGSKLFEDFKTGFWGRFFNKEPQQVDVEMEVFESNVSGEQLQRFENLTKLAQDVNFINDRSFFANHVDYASTKNHLNPYDPHDLISTLINATVGFVEFFKDGIFAKHPITGFIAALAYAFGGAAVMAPGTLKLILTRAGFSQGQIHAIIVACQQLGRPIAKGSASQAIASGFTLAKIMGVSMNASAQGFDSALAKIIDEVRKDPLLYGAGICVSYGFGNLVTNIIKVPYLTGYLRDEIGTAPAIGRILIGAKLGMLSLEAALPEDERHSSILAEFLADIAANVMLGLRLLCSPLSLSTKPYKDSFTQLKKGFGIVATGLNKLITTSVQMVMVLPKIFLEVSTTLYVNSAKAINYLKNKVVKNTNHQVATTSSVIRFKNDLIQKGSNVGNIVREKLSRTVDRQCGRIVQPLYGSEHEIPHEYRSIFTKLSLPPQAQPAQEEQRDLEPMSRNIH